MELRWNWCPISCSHLNGEALQALTRKKAYQALYTLNFVPTLKIKLCLITLLLSGSSMLIFFFCNPFWEPCSLPPVLLIWGFFFQEQSLPSSCPPSFSLSMVKSSSPLVQIPGLTLAICVTLWGKCWASLNLSVLIQRTEIITLSDKIVIRRNKEITH